MSDGDVMIEQVADLADGPALLVAVAGKASAASLQVEAEVRSAADAALATAVTAKAAAVHTHTAAQITDATAAGRALLTATDAAAQRAAINADAAGAAAAAQAAAVQRANHTGTQSADTLTDGAANKAYLATERAKLAGIADNATANATDALLRSRATHTGTQSADTLTDGAGKAAYLLTERAKLNGIAAGATANATDAQLRDRATHTGTQAVSTVTGLQTTLNAKYTNNYGGLNAGSLYFQTSLQILDGGTDDLIASFDGDAGDEPGLNLYRDCHVYGFMTVSDGIVAKNGTYVTTTTADSLTIDSAAGGITGIRARSGGANKGYWAIVNTPNNFFGDSLPGDMVFRSEANRVLFGSGGGSSTMVVGAPAAGVAVTALGSTGTISYDGNRGGGVRVWSVSDNSGGWLQSAFGNVFFQFGCRYTGSGFVRTSASGSSLIQASSSSIFFGLGSSGAADTDVLMAYVAKLDANGNFGVGFGTGDAPSRIAANGDLEATGGLILQSANGTRYRIKPANGGGSLTITAV